MENASKALIIAGAILIAILLISIGIMVMNSINEPLNQAEDEAKVISVQQFNSKFTPYAGEQNGKSVKSLMNIVISINASVKLEEASPIKKEIVILTPEKESYTTANIIRDPGWVQAHIIDSETYRVVTQDGSYSWREENIEELVGQSQEGYIDTVKIYGKFK